MLQRITRVSVTEGEFCSRFCGKLDQFAMHFRLTQKLAKKIKETGTLPALEAHQNPLADWIANFFTADRTQYVIVCNTATMYTCLFYGAGVNNDDKFIKAALQAVRDAMEDEGLERVYLDKIVPATGNVCFGKSLNRSITGSVTEQINAAKFYQEDSTRAPYQVAEMLNGNLLSYLGENKGDYGKPKEAFHALCQRVSPPQPFEGEFPPTFSSSRSPSVVSQTRSSQVPAAQNWCQLSQVGAGRGAGNLR